VLFVPEIGDVAALTSLEYLHLIIKVLNWCILLRPDHTLGLTSVSIFF
jgi:hypothetical protein